MRKPLISDAASNPKPTSNLPYDVSPFDKQCAIKFRTKLIETNQVKKPISIQLWSYEFSKLRRIQKISEAAIQETLDWYLDHLGMKYVPQALSAKTFRNKFDVIVEAMKRNAEELPTSNSNPLSPDAEYILSVVNEMEWNSKSRTMLSAVVSTSLARYVSFYNKRQSTIEALRCQQVNISPADIQKWQRFDVHIDSWLLPPKQFMLAWFRAGYEKLSSWSKWNGSIKPLIFSESSERFNEMGAELANEFCYDPNRWNLYLKVLNAETSNTSSQA